MHPLLNYQLGGLGKVTTIYILKTGEIIESREEYLKIEDRFTWVDRRKIIDRILQLRGMTDTNRKSVIAIYEKDHSIREFVNVEVQFSPLSYTYNS